MKLYAYAREEGEYRLIDVWEAARIRDREPELFSKLRYYSTELNLDKRRELVLVRREGRLFFRYKEQPEEPVSATAQTLTHLKAKEILSRMRRLRFLLPGGELTLWVQGWEPEKRILLPEGGMAIADLCCEVMASQPPEAAARWQGRLLVEITVTHPSAPERIAALESQGWPVIEVPIGPRLRIPEGLGISEKEVRQAEAAMESCFRHGIRGRIVADPGKTLLQEQPGLWSALVRFIDEMITN